MADGGASWILPALGVGAGFGQGFFAPEGQKVRSFAGEKVKLPGNPTFSIDPGTHLGLALQDLNQIMDIYRGRAEAPITLGNTLPSAFVQQPATFSGGGLPMDIGVTGFDLANPLYTPTPPPGGFGFDLQSLIDQIRGNPVGPKTPPDFNNPTRFTTGGPTRGTGDPLGTRFEGRSPDDGAPGEPGFLPPTVRPPKVPGPNDPYQLVDPNDPPEGELPVVTPPTGTPPQPRERDRRWWEFPFGGGDDPFAFMPPREAPPGDVRTYEKYKPIIPKTSEMTTSNFQADFQPTTMQDALELLGFPMNSITRRRT